jgi:hypothetical protein
MESNCWEKVNVGNKNMNTIKKTLLLLIENINYFGPAEGPIFCKLD